jgi:hypothetical protein
MGEKDTPALAARSAASASVPRACGDEPALTIVLGALPFRVPRACGDEAENDGAVISQGHPDRSV